MLINKAMKGIGKYALSLTNYQMFGTDKPEFTNGAELLLYSFALNSGYLSVTEIQLIDKRITDLTL